MHQANPEDGRYPTATGYGYLDDDGVVHFVCAADAQIDEAAAIVNTEAIVAAAKGGRYPLIVEMVEIKSIDAKGRRYHAQESGKYFTAVALLVHSPLSRVIGNFFLGLNRPDYPLQVFDDKAAAITWLKRSVE